MVVNPFVETAFLSEPRHYIFFLVCKYVTMICYLWLQASAYSKVKQSHHTPWKPLKGEEA
jgi:hypothetical protein